MSLKRRTFLQILTFNLHLFTPTGNQSQRETGEWSKQLVIKFVQPPKVIPWLVVFNLWLSLVLGFTPLLQPLPPLCLQHMKLDIV